MRSSWPRRSGAAALSLAGVIALGVGLPVTRELSGRMSRLRGA